MSTIARPTALGAPVARTGHVAHGCGVVGRARRRQLGEHGRKPALDAHFVEEDDPHLNPLGVKGPGEISMIGVVPAIANAIFHATGRRLRELPIRLEALL